MIRRSKIVEATGSLPIGARQYMKACFLEGRDAALRGDAETRNARARTLGRFASVHGVQAAMGLAYATMNTYYAVRHGSVVDASAAVYDGVYAVVQSGVAYTQAYLARSLRSMPAETAAPNEYEVGSDSNVPVAYDRSASLTEHVVVRVAQTAFLATVINASANMVHDPLISLAQ